MMCVATTFAQSSTTQSVQPPPIPTLRANVRRVVVDVVVTDQKGHPVKGLTQQDFSVFENNAPQTIKSFEVHTATTAEYVPPTIPKLPANTFLNLPTAPPTGTPTVLLYDVLNTPLEAQAYAHAQMVSFLKQRKPGTQVAIFVLGDKLHMLQGFTDNTDQLTRALEQKKGQPSPSLLLGSSEAANGISQGGSTSTDPSSMLAGTAGNTNAAADSQDLSFSAIVSMMGHMESLDRSAMLDRRVEITIDALTEIGRFLGGLPGRKNLIWLSGSFPAAILVDEQSADSQFDHGQASRNYGPELKEATDLLNVGHVAVYPIDVRGVQVNPMFSAASKQTFVPGSGSDQRAVLNFGRQQASEHASMDAIAESTGGHAYYGTNDLREAVGLAMDSGSIYYSLSYSPTNSEFDGRVRRIKVKLQQSGYNLAYRTSYFADDPSEVAQDAADAPVSPLTSSLEHGTPTAHELIFEAHLDAVGAPAPATPEQMEVLATYEAMRQPLHRRKGQPAPVKPILMQRYVIQYGLIPRQLDMPIQADGAHQASLEFGVISYDEDGHKLNGIDTRVQDTIPPPRYARIEETGYQVVQAISVPVTALSLRLAVRDVLSNHIGSIEVALPLAKSP